MSYPYPPLLSLLKFFCTPDEYKQRIKPHIGWRGGIKNPPIGDAYWQVVPLYTYAICPICRHEYREPADTYSLGGWGPYPDLMPALYVIPSEYPTNPPCAHFLGIHAFLNLHGHLPTEVDYLSNRTGEVPYLTPWFFPDDIESYAVLHALPICRLEAEQFVPRYTIFSLTYFSQQPKEVLQRHYAEEAEYAKGDPEYYGTTVCPAPIYPVRLDEALYDLSAWAARGQLGWLDFTRADTPLRIGAGLQLPETYRNIQGNRNIYVWRKGKMHPW